MRKLLFILAHPDDETFIAGGTIAKYAEAGVHVGLVCATRGERGATADLCSIPELPDVRYSELREAARILGIGDLEVLHYEDQKLAVAPPDVIRREIVNAIRRVRPQIVLTFDPNGSNQHSDHIAISRFAADAVSAAADARWYPETGAPHVIDRLLWQSPTPVFQLARTANLTGQPGIDFVIDIAPFSEKKRAALSAHRTQYPGLKKVFFGTEAGEKTINLEAFRVGWGPRPRAVPASDLFAD